MLKSWGTISLRNMSYGQGCCAAANRVQAVNTRSAQRACKPMLYVVLLLCKLQVQAACPSDVLCVRQLKRNLFVIDFVCQVVNFFFAEVKHQLAQFALRRSVVASEIGW